MKRDQPSDPMPVAGATPARADPLDWPRLAGRTESVARAIEEYAHRRRQRRIIATAAAGVFMFAVAVGWREHGKKSAAAASVSGATTQALVSMPVRQTLSDGSIVELKAGAEIVVNFTAASPGPRRVTLKRGTAHFSVTKNPQRPFVVAVDGVEVRAVGTAFAVQRDDTAVEVLVTEGRVALDQPVPAGTVTPLPNGDLVPSSSPPLAFVDAGSRAVVATDHHAIEARVEAVSAPELEERLSWRVPRLEFNATPLADVIALFNRHAVRGADRSVITLTLTDSELRALPLSGTLRADNVPVLLQILESSYGIKAESRPGGEVLLRKAP